MSSQAVKIAKSQRQVALWVHPEGRVYGAIFVAVNEVNEQSEDPRAVLNVNAPFLVLKRKNPDQIRFYNRSSIIRVEYDETPPTDPQCIRLQCRILLMDNSIIDGKIFEILPSAHARLYDYLNQANDRFIKVFTSDSQVCLVNKSYIIQVTT